MEIMGGEGGKNLGNGERGECGDKWGEKGYEGREEL